MDTVLRDLAFTFVYKDDILITSHNKAEHMVHLRQVLERLQQHGLVINLAKCQFGRQELDFLGHHITKHGITPLPSKVDVIREFTQPTTVKGLQEFIGIVIVLYREQQPPCNPALVGKPKELQWDETMIAAFNRTKEALANAGMPPCFPIPMLIPPLLSLSMHQE